VLSDLNNDFPFDDAEFNVVIAMMVVEHLFDPFHSFSQMARICRPGGKVFVNLPNIASIKCRWALLQGRMPITSSPDWFEKREWDGNHLHNFTISDTLKLASLYGLSSAQIHPVGRSLIAKRMMPGLFCHEISYCFLKR
jgi:SAM-dependent methyltransferase